jgi:hypothetical protein
MMLFPIRIEHPLDVAVQCPHDADARKHRRSAVAFGDHDQRLDRSLPFLELLFGLWQLLDISGGILKSDKLATAGQRDRIFEFALPTPIAMTPTFFIEFGSKTLRRPWRRIIVTRVAPWTRCAGGATGAGVLAFPRSIRVRFANPTRVLAERASHSASYPIDRMRSGDVRYMDHGVLKSVAIERFTTGARHERVRHLRRHPLASFPHRIFALGPIALVAPGLIVGLRPLGREYSPCCLEVRARLVKGGGRAVKVLAWFTARVEAASPTPRVLMMRNASANRDRADVDVTEIDVPAIGALGIAAAGELGHAPLKRAPSG